MLQQQLLPGFCFEVAIISLLAEVGTVVMYDDVDSVSSSAVDRMFCVTTISSAQYRHCLRIQLRLILMHWKKKTVVS